MAILARIKDFLVRNLSLTDEKAWNRSLWTLAGSASLSGEVVTEDTALNFSPVWSAVSLIAGTVGALPLHLMQQGEGSKRLAVDHPLYQVMHDTPNEYMTAMAFRETMMGHVLLWGNGYAEIVRNGLGRIVGLWPITPDRVRVDVKGGRIFYTIRMEDRRDIVLPRDKILHIPGLGFDGFYGYSVVSMARKSIGLGMAMETFGSMYFGNGTHPGVIVTHPGKLSETARGNLEGSLVTEYSGLGKSHRLLLLEEGMTIDKIGIPPEDSQFLESRQFHVTEIARWFNLPPHKIKDLSRSSFSNIESEQISFVTDSILPWLVRLEQNYNMQLLTAGDRGLYGRGRLYFKHNVEGLLRGDSASRAAFYAQMFNIGAMSPNEIREKEDMDPYPGGDMRLIPMNMVPVDAAKKMALMKAQPPKELPPPEEAEEEEPEEEEEVESS